MYRLNRLFTAAAAAPYQKRCHSTRRSLAATAGIGQIRERPNKCERKRLPPELSRRVVKLTCEPAADGGVCSVYLVGFNWDCPREVEEIIRFLKPEVLFLDLCSHKAHCLTSKTMKVPTIREMVGMWKKNYHPIWILQRWHAAKVSCRLDHMFGEQFRIPYKEAMKHGAKVILGDRLAETTFRRYWGKASLWEIVSIIQGFELPIHMAKTAKNKTDLLNLYFQEISKKYPVWEEINIHECTQYMSAKLLEVAGEHKSVIAVVNDYLIQGIQKNWKQPIDMKQLLEVPTKKNIISTDKILIAILIFMILGWWF